MAEPDDLTEDQLIAYLTAMSAKFDGIQRVVTRLAERGKKREAAIAAVQDLCDNARVIYDDQDNEIEYVETADLRAVLKDIVSTPPV